MKANSDSVVYGVLQDELDRNRRMQARYRQEIDQLPKGSLFLRKIKQHQYYYLNYREQDKVIAKYLGKRDDVQIEDIKKLIAERRRYEDLLKKLSREEKMLMKALR
ncbi:MAG: hypothetical protein Q8S22_03890 [Eubacteriales bacterium]|jgi:hypothetical protein|nr:hypothetical protein [Eubacteriales bacterium]